MSDFPYITVLTFTPLVGAVVVAGLHSQNKRAARALALVCAMIPLGMAALMWHGFDPALQRMQFAERHDWIPSLGVEYFVGVDGLGLLMVLLSALLVPMAMLASWNMEDRPGLYFSLMLFLQAGLFGTFTALNFFHWFIFWELSLIPAFFLIKLWGGPRRGAAATQFLIYTMAGSVTMLLAFLAMRYATGTFDFLELARKGRSGELTALLAAKLGWYELTQWRLAMVIFAGVFLGFAVKVPILPFHTWLPPAYAEAPSTTTMLLTGAMSKMGMYGFLRILLPIFPEQTRAVLTPLLWLAVASIVLSACAAFAQRDLKRMLAYSSINHLGYCLLGAFAAMSSGTGLLRVSGEQAGGISALATEKAAALNGVFLQMFNHGLTAATLFMFVGFIEKRSGGLRGMDDFGGLRKVAPVLCGTMCIALFSSLGLPGLNGFVGEFLIFKGEFPLAPWAAAASVLGLLVTAVFLLTLMQRVFHGPLNEKWSGLPDLTPGERALVAVPIALMFLLGIWPQLVLGVINPTVVWMLGQMRF